MGERFQHDPAWSGALRRLAASRRPVAVVIGSLAHQGLSYARSLGRRGVPTLILDRTIPRRITRTRYAAVAAFPDPATQPQACLEQLLAIGARLRQPGVLMVTGDRDSAVVSQNAHALSRYFRFVVPPWPTLRTILSKRTQYEAAAAAGIPLPFTSYPETVEDVVRVAPDLTYPCILKPYRSCSHASVRKVVVAETPRALINGYHSVADANTRFMIQEIISGDEDALYGYLGFWSEVGHEAAWLVKRKVRQHPPRFGNGACQITTEEPEVAELSRRLLGALGYRGFVGVEWKRDARDGRFRLIEINPRTVFGNQMAISAGVDFPWIGYTYLTTGRLPEPHPRGYERDVMFVHEVADFRAFRALHREGSLRLAGWLASLCRARSWSLAALDDPGPLIGAIAELAYEAVRARLRRRRALSVRPTVVDPVPVPISGEPVLTSAVA